MFEACTSMAAASWICWTVQVTALLLIGFLLWRMVRRQSGGPGTRIGSPVPWGVKPLAVPAYAERTGSGRPYRKP